MLITRTATSPGSCRALAHQRLHVLRPALGESKNLGQYRPDIYEHAPHACEYSRASRRSANGCSTAYTSPWMQLCFSSR